MISAYESGQRQPSLPALARLIDAAGFELTLGLRRWPGLLRGLSGPWAAGSAATGKISSPRPQRMGSATCGCSAAWPAAKTAPTVTWTFSPTYHLG